MCGAMCQLCNGIFCNNTRPRWRQCTPLPENLDGGSLRDVLERGNAAGVERPVEGMVFHYPCYLRHQ